jgi:hypothetical protein
MDGVALNGKVCPCVEVVEACGEWFVRVIEEDQELTRSFEIEILRAGLCGRPATTSGACRFHPSVTWGRPAQRGHGFGEAASAIHPIG